jgi:hypothetical protein
VFFIRPRAWETPAEPLRCKAGLHKDTPQGQISLAHLRTVKHGEENQKSNWNKPMKLQCDKLDDNDKSAVKIIHMHQEITNGINGNQTVIKNI